MGWFAAAAPFIAQGLNMLGGWAGANQQQAINKSLAKLQHKQNMELLKYQLDYNTPANQMLRFSEAGLNPHLVYGQGTAGNMESAPKYPDIAPANYQGILSDVGTKLLQARLMSSQADLTDTKVQESTTKQELMKAQKSLVQANPYLNSAYVESMVSSLRSAAIMKNQQKNWMIGFDSLDPGSRSRGFQKMDQELRNLEQKFNLGSSDQAIKAKVLESKEFQNELQKIQLDWMKDADITPQHIYMGIMMLLQKMM